jgi:acetolactate synthase-1/3 small subunit
MKNNEGEKHVLSLLVQNEPGVLSRISGLFSGRGFNIESLAVAATLENTVSRVTLVTLGDQVIVEQIKKQLNKIISVVKVIDLEGSPYVKRELALIKVRAKPEHRAEILRMVDIFRCRVVDVNQDYYTIEVTGDEEKIEAFLDLVRPTGIKEIARTGVIALPREKRAVNR